MFGNNPYFIGYRKWNFKMWRYFWFFNFPFRSQFGYHIVKLTDVKKFEEANLADIKRNVFDEKRIKLFNEYMDSLKKKYKVTINKSAIK